MATLVPDTRSAAPVRTIAPDTYERILAIASVMLLVAVVTAVVRGRADWGAVPPAVWVHLATIAVALVLTPVLLLRRRGTRLHRRLGQVWAVALIATALVSFDIRMIAQGRFSWIHLLSLWTLVQVPLLWWSARRHQVARHRSAVRGMVTGALLIAGFFTFPFDRMLGHWLFG